MRLNLFISMVENYIQLEIMVQDEFYCLPRQQLRGLCIKDMNLK